jgi:uncharacterized membrane protein YccC
MSDDQRTFFETVVRVIHVIAGTAALAVSVWFLFVVMPFNPYGFFGFLIVGGVLLFVGLRGSRKDIFLTFFTSGF